MNDNSSTIEIYWSPFFERGLVDWSMLYQGKISTLYDEMRSEMNHDAEPLGNLFYCPAFKNLTPNVAVLKNIMKSQFKIENDNLVPVLRSSISSQIPRKPSMDGRHHLEFGLGWIFFSEDDVEISMTSPYFDTPNHMKYGNVVPGKFNISSWFRKITPEFVLKKGVNEFEIGEEDIVYLTFNTQKKLKFTRFEMTDTLRSYARACSSSTEWEQWSELETRYERFNKSEMPKLVLNEIRKNLIY